MQHFPTKNLWLFIWHFLRPYKASVVLFSILAIMTGFWSPINNMLIKYMIDTLETTQGQDALAVIWLPALFFIINFEAHNLYWRAMNYLNYKYQADIKNKIITETFKYVQQHSYQFFQDNLSGRIASQINKLAENIERVVHDVIRHLIRAVVLLIVSFCSMYYVHPQFFYVLFAWFIIFTILSMKFSNRIVNLSEANAEANSTLTGQLVDSITNASNIRIFARNDYEVSYLQKALLATKDTFQKKELFMVKLHFFQGLSLSIMLSLMLYLLINLKTQNMVTMGDFALILGLSVEVGYMTWWGLEQLDDMNKALGECMQSFRSLFTHIEIEDSTHAQELNITNGKVEFKNVKFHYKGAQPLFQNMSINITRQKVGLVGRSGSGKTTFVKLLLRFNEINSGIISIDGQDIKHVTQDSLRNNIALIPQDPSLFHRTLMENIRYGRINASDEEVLQAAQKAHAHEFISILPEGYDSLVGERGVKLSGGQRQRIAIARAILKNAPILILDEATSQLDALTENNIQDSLWRLMETDTKTVIVIAHRLSTLLHMDRILVFDNGEIIEDGKHEELLARNGHYKRMWEAQVGGFLQDE